MKILVAQLGARRRYTVPLALHRAGMLGLFVTDVSAADAVGRMASRAARCFPTRFLSKLAQRRIPEIPREKIRSFPWLGVRRRIASTIRGETTVRLRHAQDNKTFCQSVTNLRLQEFDAVYVFNTAGLEIARLAKERGVRVILDQTCAPIRVEEEILAEERKTWPDWEPATELSRGWEELAAREEAEWAIADLILCGSDYVYNSLRQHGVDIKKCRVVPTGVCSTPTQDPASKTILDRFSARTVVFAGTLCLRKGIPYLAEAAAVLKNRVNFNVAGPSILTNHGLRCVCDGMRYLGNLPRQALFHEYQKSSVFVLPTLSEGSANVCYEAIAAGLPVITTPNAGSPISSGRDGVLIAPRSAEAIVAGIESLLNDSEKYIAVASHALATCRGYSLDAYVSRLAEVICDTLQ